MITRSRIHLTSRVLVTGSILACTAVTGCSERWDYYSLRGVQTQMPPLMDRQWSQRREYSQAEMLAVRAGGDQTVLVARAMRHPVHNDVAQLDEQVSRTFVMTIDEPLQAGKTYRITPENGRLIEGTTFRPAWRPYQGLEGELTVLSVSSSSIRAAVRVSTLTLKTTDPTRSLRGAHTFKTARGDEPELYQAQINFAGGPPTGPGGQTVSEDLP
jgi:hypothetical protein